MSTPRNHAAGRPELLPPLAEQQKTRDLCEGFDHQHAGHERRAGKMPLKKLLVHRDVLDGDDAPAGLMVRDGVDKN